jgi:hypothetical protein
MISATNLLVPWVREMMVLPAFLVSKIEGALMEYNSFLKKGSTAFFLPPFFPFVNLLFLPEQKQRKIVPKSVPTILAHQQRCAEASCHLPIAIFNRLYVTELRYVIAKQ